MSAAYVTEAASFQQTDNYRPYQMLFTERTCIGRDSVKNKTKKTTRLRVTEGISFHTFSDFEFTNEDSHHSLCDALAKDL